jgi:hypothetical protein
LAKFEFESGTFWWFYYLYLVRLENHVCLSHGAQLACAAWWAVMRIMAGVGDLVQGTRDGRNVRYSVAGQSRDRVTSCVVCTVHEETRSTSFLVEPQNQG